MDNNLQSQVHNMNTNHRHKGIWYRIVSALGCIVTFCTVYALILPAITMESVDRELVCRLSVHQHSGECRDAQGKLVCGKAEYVVHTHDINCYDRDEQLVCDLPEVKAHTHTDACYQTSPVLVCQEEPHVHDDSCYEIIPAATSESTDETSETEATEVPQRVLICGLTEHSHGELCYDTTKTLICYEKEIILHTHNSNCYEDDVLICGKLEITQHIHEDMCFVQEEETPDNTEGETAPAETNPDEIPASVPSETEATEAPTTAPTEPEATEEPTTAPTEPEATEEPTTAPTEPEATEEPTTAPTEPEATEEPTIPATEPPKAEAGANSQQVQTTAEDVTVIDSGFCGKNNLEDIQWTLTSDGVLTISGTGEMKHFGNYSPNQAPWYSNKAQITSVVIKDGITALGNYAFYSCSNLTSVQIPESITSFGDYVFYSCSKLTAIDLPDYMTELGSNCFASCSALTSIHVPEGITSLGYKVFYNCRKLTDIHLPDSLTEMWNQTFRGCTGLTSITIPDAVTKIGSDTFWDCSNLTSIIFPDSLTTIGSNAFYNCSKLTSIDIPEGVISIGSNAFQNCYQLSIITLPDNLTSIGSGAFQNCRSLTSVTIPDGVTKIESNTFNGCSALEHVSIGSGVTEISSDAFGNCPMLASLDVDPENQSFCIVDGVLFSMDMTTLILYPAAYARTEYQIPDSVTSIGSSAFKGCTSLKEVTIPDSVITIAANTFSNCTSLVTVDIPNGVTSIGDSAFSGCTSLVAVDIPKSVTSIGKEAFYNCKALQEIVIPEGVTNIDASTFYNCIWLGKVSLPESLTSIGKEAFYQCSGLREIIIPNNVSSIGTDAFYYCNKLISVVLPHRLNNLGDSFQGCTKLTEITLQNGTVSFYNNASQFRNLRRVIIGNQVDTINSSVLDTIMAASPNINELIISGPNYFSFVGKNYTSQKLVLTEDCYYVDEAGVIYRLNSDYTAELVYVPEEYPESSYAILASIPVENSIDETYTVTSIGANAFLNCNNLETVTIPDTIKHLGSFAFANCSKLTNLNGQTTLSAVMSTWIPYGANSTTFMGTALWQEGVDTYFKATTDPIVIMTTEEKGREVTLSIASDHSVLTGQAVTSTVTIDKGEYDSNNVVRIYFQFADEHGSIGYAPGSYIFDGVNVTVFEASAPNTYFIEIEPMKAGQTFKLNIDSIYANIVSGGGPAMIWIDALTLEEAEKLGTGLTSPDAVHMPQWSTIPDVFPVKKTASGSPPTFSQYMGSENLLSVSGVSFKISISRAENTLDYGKDHITSVDFVDTITLPEHFFWNPQHIKAIRAGNYEINTNYGYIKVWIDGSSIEIGRISTTAQDVVLDVDENGNLQYKWTYWNPSKSLEIPPADFTLTISGGLILADAEKLGQQVMDSGTESIVVQVYNQVTATEHFTYSKDQYQEASATWNISIGKASYSIQKTAGTSSFEMGYRYTYDITVHNYGTLPYTTLDYVEDPLPDYCFITPGDMETMFYQDTYGKDLSIVITNAYLLKEPIYQTIIGTDGKEYTITQQMQGINVPYEGKALEDTGLLTNNATITIGWSDDSSHLVLTVSYNGAETVYPISQSQTIQSMLDSIGYFVASNTKYTCKWNQRGQTLYAGYGHRFYVRVTVKDTFMRLTGDQDWHIVNSSTYVSQFYNYAYSYSLDQSVKSYGHKASISRDFTLYKWSYLDGALTDEQTQVEAGDILTYRSQVTHSGRGSYDALPMVDNMEGAQVLLVSVDDNTSLSGKGLDVMSWSGKSYYLLNQEGIYRSIMVGGYLADRVEVTRSDNGLNTMIYWYLTDIKGAATITAEYQALVSPKKTGLVSDEAVYRLSNEVWLNDHPSHRLYATAYLNGTILRINKFIVTNMDERDPESASPHNSMLDVLSKRTHVGEGDAVTYRLMLQGIGSDSITIKGDAIYDTLPESLCNYWTEENIRVSYVAGPDSSFSIENAREDGKDWYIESTEPDESGVTQQYLHWNDEFSITLNGTLYIYVTLEFPSETDWDNYAHVFALQDLRNTFHVFQLQDDVFHYLEIPGKVFLQKGVLNTGMGYARDHGSYVQYIRNENEDALFHYSNDGQNFGLVTYYVTLYNGGEARLYLSDIQDVLPQGFTIHSLYLSSTQAYYITYDRSPTSNSQAYYTVAVADNKTVYKKAAIHVSYAMNENGQQVVCFSLHNSDSIGNLSYDPEFDKYYLCPGEAITFAYNCNTNGYMDTQDVATNAVAMPFFDYNGGGLVLDTETTANTRGSSSISPNNGGRGSITNGQADLIGLNTDSTDDSIQWLFSSVSLSRGSILPGITKTSEKSFANVTAAIPWSIHISNSGTDDMRGYTITDVMMAPYQFTGTVTYEIFHSTWKYERVYIDNLFTFGTRAANDTEVTITSKNSSAVLEVNGDYQELLTNIHLYGKDANGYGFSHTYDIAIDVRLCRDEKGNEILSVRFPESNDSQFNVPSNGSALMTLQTENFGNVFRNTTYFNTSYLTPSVNQPFDSSAVSQGNYTIYEELDSVVSEANVAVSYGYATASLKSVTELANTANTASSTNSTNYIVLPENESVFRYTLEVQNTGGNLQSKAMDLLVLIDNLPEVGDHTTFYTDIPRRSEFRVDFAPNPDIVVSVNGIPLDFTQYTVEYSAKTEFGESDWKGNASEDWKAGTPSGARSLRIIIKDEAGKVVPAGAIIRVSFNAVIGADSGTLKPSLIAWNSFGYHYSLVGEATELEAAPQKVGIKIPSVPVLVKELQNSAGGAYTASERLTFRFVIYEGDAVTLPEIISEADVYAALDSRNFTVAEVTVEPGKSASEPLLLNTLHRWSYVNGVATETTEDWSWKNLTRYTIVELPSENEDYYFGSINRQSRNNFTFSYSAATDRTLTCINIRDVWQFHVIKRCAATQGTLSGAVFGLYSPDRAEQISEDAYQALVENLDEAPEKTISVDDTQWYLMDIQTTSTNGIVEFVDLTAERYYLLELQAPAGYFLNEEPGQWITVEDASAEVSITNQTGVKLPATGGLGSEFFSILGVILMGSTGYLGYSRKRRNNR